MELLQIREKEIFDVLKAAKDIEFTVIGGYAVNAYTMPRFSVDCDIAIKDETELKKIRNLLAELNYSRKSSSEIEVYYSAFERYEKNIKDDFIVSIDIFIKNLVERQTNAVFSTDWIFENSKIRALKGKTINEEIKTRIIDIDALFAMKMVSCRPADIRDVFMLAAGIKNRNWVKEEVSKHYDFNKLFSKIKNKITSKQFKDGLQGVFGIIDEKLFEKHKKIILNLGEMKNQ